jgi:hypothetical protein
MVPVINIAQSGIDRFGSTCTFVSRQLYPRYLTSTEPVRTFLSHPESGSPLSLEKAQVCLEAEATNPKVAKTYIVINKEVNTVVPPLDCSAFWKI